MLQIYLIFEYGDEADSNCNAIITDIVLNTLESDT